MNITPRLLKEAQQQAKLQSNRIRTAYTRGQIKSWDDITRLFSIEVPESFKSKPFTYINVGANIGSFTAFWEMSVSQRLEHATSAPATPIEKIRIDKAVDQYGTITLHPEQQGCYRAMYEALFTKNESAVLHDGPTGSGKTITAGSIIALCEKEGFRNRPENKYRLYPYIVFCPKGIEEHWYREFEKLGLGELIRTRKIMVFTDTSFDTKSKSIFVHEEENFITEEVKLVWDPILSPIVAIVDEYHRYVNRDTFRTKALMALVQCPVKCKFIFMSATPMEKVNDSYLFTVAANKIFMGMKVDCNSFKYFSQLIDPTPQKPNREALKRLRTVLASNIFSLPYVKPKHKAINMVWVVGFENDRAREIYKTAHERLQEARRKAGKNTSYGRFQALVALNDYRCTVEPLRAWAVAQRVADNYRSGLLATACGSAYKEMITNVAYRLVNDYKIPREHISIIWGGKREYRPEDILTQEQLNDLLKDPEWLKKLGNPSLLKKVKISLRYLQDKFEHQESTEEQSIRHTTLKELRLVGNQSINARQIEIDKFQSGEAKICLFTNASGGVGLSLDRSAESLLPREGIFTPVYSGKEFQQVLGRLVRRQSLSDANQFICMMAGTVEEHHVVPILDEKLKCIAEITNRNFDIVDLLTRSVDGLLTRTKVRSIEEATKDAENDNTIVTDFVPPENEEDEDDDEITEGILHQ